MILEELLGDFPRAAFLERHYFRLPYSRPGGAKALASLADWGVVERILGQAGVDAFLAREGRQWEGGTPSGARARELFGQGYTVVVRDAQKHDPGLGDLARRFHEDFRAPVNVHLYCTPAGTSGFGWHYDVEDVFILEARGVKEYRLRKNTVHPWPTLATMSRDLKFEREVTPFWTCRLAPGDWLYIPPGWWHEARGQDESITLAVGLMSPAAVDLLEFLRKELAQSVVWRQRLPVLGAANPATPDELVAQYRTLLAELGKDLARLLGEESFVRRFLNFQGQGKVD